jgi:hypothetical protein
MSDLLVMEGDKPASSAVSRLMLATLTVAGLCYLWWEGYSSRLPGVAASVVPWMFCALYVMSLITAVMSFLAAWFKNLLPAPWGAHRIRFRTARGLTAKCISVRTFLTSRLEMIGVRRVMKTVYETASVVTNFVFLPLAFILPGGWVARRGIVEDRIVRTRDVDGNFVSYTPSCGLPKKYYDPSKIHSLEKVQRVERTSRTPIARPHDIEKMIHRFGRGAQIVDFTFAVGSVLVSAAWLTLR